jgi:hypothetical protein
VAGAAAVAAAANVREGAGKFCTTQLGQQGA